MTNDTRPLTEDTREAIGKVIARWYKTGLLRFNSHDDGSDDLLLRDEIVRALAAARGEPPEPAIDVERRCPHCKLTATRIGDIHIDAQDIIERTQP